MRIGLCVFSFTGSVREAGLRPDPLDPHDLMKMAADNGLASVEFPASVLPDASPAGLARARGRLEDLGLRVTLAAGAVRADDLRQQLPMAKALGAKSVRTVLSGILEGDRRKPPGPEWPAHLERLVGELKEVKAQAEDLGVSIALENHQDATSDDLVGMCQAAGSPMVGVTLDTGNALAVGEDPIEYARRVAPYLKNVHLKDYWIYETESGYRLVRCPFGEGVVPFAELFGLFDAQAPEATCNIENGATTARHIRLLEDEFWRYYPTRAVSAVLPALRIARRQARPQAEDWRTPHERGESAQARAAYEMDQFRRSVESAHRLMKSAAPFGLHGFH
ncbi:MAG: sugar phosphate isomerase/epimerase [Planctomycetes bacterium]|nr:sugar phosphate isomerase/epimerase [Planctomycetota bacterium]